MKICHPEIQFLTETTSQPYALQNLIEIFFSGKNLGLAGIDWQRSHTKPRESHHFAKLNDNEIDIDEEDDYDEENSGLAFTCESIADLFLRVLYPLEKSFLRSPHWKVTCKALLSHRKLTETGKPIPPVLDLVMNVSWFKWWRADKICPYLNGELENSRRRFGETFTVLKGPTSVFGCSHLVQWAKLKMGGTKYAGNDEWYQIIRQIEFLFRNEFGIYNDAIILEPLQKIVDGSSDDLVNHMKKEDGVTPLFPSMPGEPISYFPLVVNDELANLIYTKLHYATIFEMCVAYLYTDMEGDDWFKWVMTRIKPEHANMLNKKKFLEIFEGNEVIIRL